MKRFDYLLKQRSKALGVFQKAHEQLVSLSHDLENEINRSQKMINEEQEAIEFARKELQTTENTRVKIEQILV